MQYNMIIEETAPLTEEQWERIMLYGRMRYGSKILPCLTAAKEFQDDMETIRRSAGVAPEAFTEISQGLLDMAKEQAE